MATKAEQSDATRRALLDAARSLFAEHGFADTSTEAVVQAAGVTRGALYHHFRDKTALFRAVYEDLEQHLVNEVSKQVDGVDEPLTMLRRGADVFLTMCLDPAVMRVVLLEGPTVLGWELWRQIDQAYGLGMVRGALEMARAAGVIKDAPLDALAHVLMGGLMEGSLYLANAAPADRAAARVEVSEALGVIIDGVSVKPAARRPGRR
jgi:AcrR family transcriptional regulator